MKRGVSKGSDWRTDRARRLKELRNILRMKRDGTYWLIESEWNGRKRAEVKE